MEGMYNTLIIIDEPAQRDLIEKALDVGEFRTVAASRGQSWQKHIQEETPHVAFIDLPRAGLRDDPVFSALVRTSLPTPCIIVTGKDREQEAFDSLGHGAFDYILSSDSPERVMAAASRAIISSQARLELTRMRSILRQTLFSLEPAGGSAAAISLKTQVEKAAATDVNVILEGEAGTGKRSTAQAIHSMGSRQGGPFVVLNCDMVPGGLLETELFGMETGTYGRSSRIRQGKVEQAGGGTLYLEDIHMLNTRLQGVLLRTISTGQVERVGGGPGAKADVRFIASSRDDLEAMVYAGEFLKELYEALCGVRIHLPPLRDRRNDIPMLLKRFLEEFAQRRGQRPPEVERTAMHRMLEYKWPGNTEELRSLAEGLTRFGANAIVTASDLPDRIRLGAKAEGQEGGQETSGMLELLSSVALPAEGLNLLLMVETLENALITKALDRTGGHQGKAAGLLGLKRTTLLGKIRKKDIR